MADRRLNERLYCRVLDLHQATAATLGFPVGAVTLRPKRKVATGDRPTLSARLGRMPRGRVGRPAAPAGRGRTLLVGYWWQEKPDGDSGVLSFAILLW